MRAGLAATRRARMRSGGHRRGGAVGACCAAVGLVMLLAACGPASGSPSGAAPAASSGGTTVTYAMQPGGVASYPFPFMGLGQSIFDTVYNIDQFQYLLYRPLYWFGTGVNPYQNPQLSLAAPPVYRGNEVTIRLKKNYKWSNGQPVDAQDVVFWMNMMKTEDSNDVYFLQTGLPRVVSNVRAVSKYVVTMTIPGPFSQSWFSSNELSEITPMPKAWDVTSLTAAPGSGGCSAASYSSITINPNNISNATGEPEPISASAKACEAVFNFLTAQASKSPTTFASSPLWRVVDGPWKIESMNSQNTLTLTFNKKYAGPVAPGHITKFIEVPFTSEAAEFNVLQDPQASQTIDVGYLPTVDALVPPAGANVGANPRTLSNYQLTAVYPWQLTYFPYNFRNTTGQAPIFDQLYFRKAFQHLVDEEGVINGPLHGYGKPIFGPVSGFPKTKYISPQLARNGDPWTLSIATATSLLSSHGWQVQRGVQTCVRPGTGPGQCGAKIAAGTQLKLSLIYVSGIDWMQSAVRELASNASLAGIQLSLTAESFNNVTGAVFDPKTCLAAKVVSCSWQMAFWGTWTYSPDYVPTGDELFEGTAPNNGGGYNDTRDNQLILDTVQARTPGQFKSAMYKWQNYLAPQLPVAYEPDYPTLVETINGLDIGPQPSSDTITPEEWHYLK